MRTNWELANFMDCLLVWWLEDHGIQSQRALTEPRRQNLRLEKDPELLLDT